MGVEPPAVVDNLSQPAARILDTRGRLADCREEPIDDRGVLFVAPKLVRLGQRRVCELCARTRRSVARVCLLSHSVPRQQTKLEVLHNIEKGFSSCSPGMACLTANGVCFQLLPPQWRFFDC